MSYFDIIFPLNLKPLTYKCPEGLDGKAQPGMIVHAPLKNRLTKGVILQKTISPPSGQIKEFMFISGQPVISRGLLKLLQWISDYYIAVPGLVLKQTIPAEIFEKVKARKSKYEASPANEVNLPEMPDIVVAPVMSAISDHKYQTFLFHSASLLHEYSLAFRLLQSSKNAIVLLPEIARADFFFNAVKDIFRERLCLLHSDIPKGKRTEYIDGIVSGKYDIIVGTRHALFAPIKSVSLIMVLHEHSSSYKLEEGTRYSIRDTAVMRGFIEKAPVVLSSISPSSDSYFNAISEKYILIKTMPVKRPRVRIVDMRFAKTVRPGISKTLFDAIKARIASNRRLMLVINRKGYSTLILCKECGHTETCNICNVPMVLYKKEGTLKCHYCGKTLEIPEKCSKCRSFNLELLGSGTQKIQEEIETLFNTEAVRFDSDEAVKKTDIRRLLHIISDDPLKVLIGTKLMTKRLSMTEKFSLTAVLNIDTSLNLPDFRAFEKSYMDLASTMEFVEPDGELIIQTRFPQSYLFKALRKNDYETFIHEELQTRKSLNYPPYSRLLNILCKGGVNQSDRMIRILEGLNSDIEVLGPNFIKGKKGLDGFSILLKSKDRKLLNSAARVVLEKFEETKDMKIRIDVDPV